MKAACGPAHMKSILAIGELGTMENVYKVQAVPKYMPRSYVTYKVSRQFCLGLVRYFFNELVGLNAMPQ